MMEIELPKMHSSQQDMDLIDILWRQDIDLGAGREVFDFSYRQKESELQKQRELEEEKRQQLLQEQEKALLAQLQLDEETGEFVPRPIAAALPQTSSTLAEVPQNVEFTEDNEDAMSFDECMQLLAETFPLVESTETAPTSLEPSISTDTNSHLMMASEQPALSQNPLLPASMDQAWLELLSIPELQQCLNLQMPDILEQTDFLDTHQPPEVQDQNYSMYMPTLTDAVASAAEACPPEYIAFDGSFTNVVPPNLSQMSLTTTEGNSNFGADGFSKMFYPDLSPKVNSTSQSCDDRNRACPLADVPGDPPLKSMDLNGLSPEAGPGFNLSKPEVMAEFPDSDSGLSLDASPNASSPEKSTHGDSSFGFSDTEMDDMDSGPGSAESDYTEIFSLSFSCDGQQPTFLVEPPPSQQQDGMVKHPKMEPVEGRGHTKPPFTKDKLKKRFEARLSRDEQRAKVLQIPFSVDMIINLPVDDFNELMSKHQLNEAQLALVRDIRRRGKNKVAAQNCRKRKMDNIVGLEYELDSLKEDKERLLREKTENSGNLRQMKQQLNSLYLEVFSLLRDEHGKPYSPSEYSLQQTSDGSMFLVPRVKKTLVKTDDK